MLIKILIIGLAHVFFLFIFLYNNLCETKIVYHKRVQVAMC